MMKTWPRVTNREDVDQNIGPLSLHLSYLHCCPRLLNLYPHLSQSLSLSLSLFLSFYAGTFRSRSFLIMDFELDDDINGDILSNSIDAIGRLSDEKGVRGSSIEGDFKLDQDILEREMVPLGITMAVSSSSSADEPYIDQEFNSEAAAHAYYNAYATRVGFVIRVSKLSRSRRDGSAIGRALVCNKEGFRMPDKREKIVRQRVETRVGCRAMVLIRKVSSGKWVITKFVQEHTHPLSPGKGRRDLVYDHYPNEHDKIRELSQQLAIEKKRSATYKRHLEIIFEHIEEHNQNLSKKIQYVVESVRKMESQDQKSHKEL